MPDTSDLNIALVGCGTVGTGVVRILQSSAELLRQRTGRSIHLRRVVVRDVRKRREVDLGSIPVSDDIRTVIHDPEIHAAIHLVGGIDPARADLISLLNSGKDVITANKALLYAHGSELFALAHIVIVPRPGFTMPDALTPSLNGAYTSRLTTDKGLLSKGFGRIYVQTVAPNAISATRLREMTWGYQPIERYTPKKVAEYIEAHNLYRS